MDPLGVNNFLSESDGGFPETAKIDFDGDDYNNIMDSAQLDQMLNEEAAGVDLNLNDSDIDKMINPEDFDLSGLGGSDGSLDKLATMPIMEVNDDQVEQLLGIIAKEENIQIPTRPLSNGNQNYQNNRYDQRMMADAQPDPLLGTLSSSVKRMSIVDNNNSGMMMMPEPQQQRMYQQMTTQNTVQEMAAEVDALQRMVDNAVMQGASNHTNNNAMQGMNQLGGMDLEQEKMKLLSRLNEINNRQNMNVGGGMPMPANVTSGNPFLMSGGMSQMQNMLRQQQKPAAVASVGSMGGSGETPLTSFLRKNQKSQPSAPAASAGRSMIGANVMGAPKAASIFSEGPMNFNNPLLSGNRNQNPLFGAMDRTTASQDMVRKLSARSLLARSDSGAHMRGGLSSHGANSGNATWGDDPNANSFKTSGILPRHVSDNHLLRAAKGGMVRSRSKQGSLSRENLMHMKRMPRNPSDDSLGALLPVKRGTIGGVKHKMGISRSVPRLANNGPQFRGGSMQQGGGGQSNAMW